MVLISTGVQTCLSENDAWLSAAKIKNADGKILVIGVGPIGQCQSLVELASGGLNYIHIDNLGNISKYTQWVLQKLLECINLFDVIIVIDSGSLNKNSKSGALSKREYFKIY